MTGTGGGAVTDTYSYDAHDKLTGITGGTNKTYGYDSNGNCTSVTVGSNVTTVAYDVENRVTSITYPSSATNTFAYNGEDLRTQKVDSSGTKNYVCDGSSPASAVLKDSAAVYTPGLSERRGSTSKFLHADALGSTRGITDSSQNVTDSMLYDAFGNVLSRTGTTPTPFGFVGASQYQTDSDSGLQLLGHRYYDPSIGRFLSQDSAKAGTNWYAYCDNNPLKKVDPKGKNALLLAGLGLSGWALVAVVVVAVVVVVVVHEIGNMPSPSAPTPSPSVPIATPATPIATPIATPTPVAPIITPRQGREINGAIDQILKGDRLRIEVLEPVDPYEQDRQPGDPSVDDIIHGWPGGPFGPIEVPRNDSKPEKGEGGSGDWKINL